MSKPADNAAPAAQGERPAAARLFETAAEWGFYRPCSLAFMLLSLAVYLPVVALRCVMEDVSVALPHRIAARLVRDSEHDIEMPTGLAILVVVLAQFLWGVLGGVSSPVGAFLLFLVSQATFNLNADHYSIYMHTETHKYWTPHGTWTFLGKGSSLLGLSLPNVPLMDYLWFLTGYPPAWGMLLGPSALSSMNTQPPHLNTLKYEVHFIF